MREEPSTEGEAGDSETSPGRRLRGSPPVLGKNVTPAERRRSARKGDQCEELRLGLAGCRASRHASNSTCLLRFLWSA